jgi:ABC-type transport system involved in cytochrome bd biosynthesis fused ATPase/permease subunit
LITIGFFNLNACFKLSGSEKNMISVKNLSFGYHDSKRIRFPDFQVTAGEHYLLLGESGSGKTTLLHLLAGLLRGYEGSLEVNQTELSSLSESALDHFNFSTQPPYQRPLR